MTSLVGCAVCMGVSDSLLARGMNAGVLVLLAITVLVVGSFAFGAVTLWRRGRTAAGDAA